MAVCSTTNFAGGFYGVVIHLNKTESNKIRNFGFRMVSHSTMSDFIRLFRFFSKKKKGFFWNPCQTRTKPIFNPCQPVLWMLKPGVSCKTSVLHNPCQTRTKPIFYPCQPVFFLWVPTTPQRPHFGMILSRFWRSRNATVSNSEFTAVSNSMVPPTANRHSNISNTLRKRHLKATALARKSLKNKSEFLHGSISTGSSCDCVWPNRCFLVPGAFVVSYPGKARDW